MSPDTDMHVMESELFRVVLDGVWVQQDLPGAPRGNAAFTHPDTGYSFFQTVVTPNPGEGGANSRAFLNSVLGGRDEMLKQNGHAVVPGKAAVTEADWGLIGVRDMVLDEQRYAMMVGYAFPELVLVHFMDGPLLERDGVSAAMARIMNTVFYKNMPGAAASS